MDEFIYRIERLKEITQNGERNERNQSILDYSILSDKKLKDLLKLSREKKKKIVEFIISNGLEPSNLKDRFIKEIQEDEFKNDEIILKAIRDILYYSLKSKGGENIE